MTRLARAIAAVGRALCGVLVLSAAADSGAAPKRILLLGDSITQGGAGLPSYRDPLIRLLRGTNINGANPSGTVYDFELVGSMDTARDSDPPNSNHPTSLALHPRHEGHYGWRADQILNGFVGTPLSGSGSGSLSTWLTGYSVDIALIHVGTNDALQQHAQPTFAADTRADIEGIIDAIRAAHPSAAIFLAKLIPMGPDGDPNTFTDDERAAAINTINDFIDSVAAAKGATVVDHNTGFSLSWLREEGFLDVHPEGTGEAFIATRWFNAIKSSLDPIGVPVITSAASASGTFGSAFSYQIAATDNPTSFGATGLPPGLSVNTSTGLVSGTPTAAGIYGANLSATNTTGTGQAGVTFTIAKATATVTLSSLAQTYTGAPRTVGVSTTPSGLNVTVTYNGGSTAPTNAGSYAVIATADGPNHQGVASGTLVVAQASQTITFAPIGDRTLAQPPLALTASATSVLPVVFEVVGGPASLSGATLTPTGEGVVVVRASQPGDANHLAAPTVTRSFTVTKAAATVTLSSLSQTFTGSPRPAQATTAPVGLNVALTYDGSTTAPTNAGGYAVVATVVDTVYQGSANGTLVVSPASQTITFAALADRTILETPVALSATASSGLPVAFTVVSGPATVAGNSLSLTGLGAVTVRASQPGNANFSAAPAVERSFTVTKATATVTLSGLSQTYDGTPRSATATTTPAGLTVGLTYDGGGTAPVGAGSYAVVATIVDATYQGSASGTLTVAPAAQTIDFPALPNRTFSTTPIQLQATSSSALPVSFSVIAGPATVAGAALTLTGVGSVTIRATQPGNPDFLAAPGVERSFTVSQASASVSLAGLSQTYAGTPRPVTASTTPSGLAVAISYAGATTPPTNAGAYAIVATIVDPNFAGSISGTLTVQKASLTARADDLQRVQGTPTPTLTITYSGFVAGENASVLDVPPSASTTATIASPPGAYPITLSGGSDGDYDITLQSGTLTVSAAPAAPVITGQPSDRSVVEGAVAEFAFTATGVPTPAYRWQRSTNGGASFQDLADGSGISGSATTTLRIAAASLAMSGQRFRATATNSEGSATTSAATLTVDTQPLRMVNLATRAISLGGDRVIIPGFVVSGDGSKRVLIRAVGPKLADFGLQGLLPDPVLSVFRQGEAAPFAANDNWRDQEPGRPDPAVIGAQLGAFALTPELSAPTDDLLSAALVLDLAPGSYSAVARDRLDRSGIGIVEIYDADSGAGAAPRLVNVSNRGFVGTGSEIMIPGFVVDGVAQRRYLIRAVGPKLADFGVAASSLLANPKLTVIRRVGGGEVEVASNEDWVAQSGGTAAVSEIEALTQQVGAFGLGPSTGRPTDDRSSAVLVVTLEPGGYTVLVSGSAGGTGIAIAEVYEIP